MDLKILTKHRKNNKSYNIRNMNFIKNTFNGSKLKLQFRRKYTYSCSLFAIFFLFWSFQGISNILLQQEPVRPEADGSLRLTAEKGKPIGPDIKYMPEWKAFGWFTSEDRVEWNVIVDESGKYDVFLEWSVSDKEAGKPFVFLAGDKKLKKKVGKTGSWETFKTKKIGRIRLPAGQQKMVFKPNSKFEEGALLDLREVRLVPVNGKKEG